MSQIKTHWSIKLQRLMALLYYFASLGTQYFPMLRWPLLGSHGELEKSCVRFWEKSHYLDCLWEPGCFCGCSCFGLYCITSGYQLMRTTEDLIFLSNSLFLPFRSGRKWPGIYSSHNGQWKGRLHWERSANPRRWWWRYTLWDSQTEAKDGYYGRDILWQMAHYSYQPELSADNVALSIVTCQVLICIRR